MIEGLNPCPEYWGEGSLRMDWNSGKSYVCCDDCRAHTQLYDEEECAIADWNSGQVISRREVKQANPEPETEIETAHPHEELKLRPCPYCGSEGKIVPYLPGYYAACENEECYAHTAVCGSAIGAADDWNGGVIFSTWYRREKSAMNEEEYENESPFNPCPNCGGELEVRDMNLVYCHDCDEYIGWYIPTAGAIRLAERWVQNA